MGRSDENGIEESESDFRELVSLADLDLLNFHLAFLFFFFFFLQLSVEHRETRTTCPHRYLSRGRAPDSIYFAIPSVRISRLLFLFQTLYERYRAKARTFFPYFKTNNDENLQSSRRARASEQTRAAAVSKLVEEHYRGADVTFVFEELE